MSTIKLICELRTPEDRLTISPPFDINCVRFESLSIPYIFNNLVDVRFHFVDSVLAAHDLVVPTGHYTITTFLTALVALLTANDAGGAVYAFALNVDHTFTISKNIGVQFQLTFQNLAVQQKLGLIGDRVSVANNMLSLVYNIDPQIINIETSIQTKGPAVSMDNYSQPTAVQNPNIYATRQYTLSVPINVPYGSNITYYFGEFGSEMYIQGNQKQIIIRLTNEYGEEINIQSQRAYIVLIYYSNAIHSSVDLLAGYQTKGNTSTYGNK